MIKRFNKKEVKSIKTIECIKNMGKELKYLIKIEVNDLKDNIII